VITLPGGVGDLPHVTSSGFSSPFRSNLNPAGCRGTSRPAPD